MARGRKVGQAVASKATSTVRKTVTKKSAAAATRSKKTAATATTTTKTVATTQTLHKFSTVKKSSSEATASKKERKLIVEPVLKEVEEDGDVESLPTEDSVDLSGNNDKNDKDKLRHSNAAEKKAAEAAATTRKNLKRRKEDDSDDEKGSEDGNGDGEDGNAASAVLPSTPKRKKSKHAVAAAADDDDEDEPHQLLSPPPSSPSRNVAFPTVLSNYISIHSNLLTHFLLHYSQKSLNTPEIVSKLIPHLARSSRKDVSLEDLRRISSLSGGTIQVVRTEQGTGIELVGDGVLGKIDALRSSFGSVVRSWWESNRERVTGSEKDDVLSAMELAPIVEPKAAKGNVSAKVVKKALLAKGQQRLSELKKFSMLKKTGTATTSRTITDAKQQLPNFNKKENAAPAPAAASARGSSLLERIRAKQAKANAAPPPPPKEYLQRQSALQSLEFIIPVLLQLSASSKRAGEKAAASTTSFPLQSVITHIKNSVKSPISADDAERAVRVLASEVAPSWCRVVEWQAVGKAEGKAPVGVVFDARGREVVHKWKWKEGM